jgi:hypothetical protein
MSNSTVVRSIRAVCLVLAVALFAPLMAATPAQAAVATFSCPGGGTYSVDNGVLQSMYSGNCSGAVVLDSTVTQIGYATGIYSGVTSIQIPSTTTVIGNQPFISGANLAAINVDEANPNYKSVDGILYNKTGTVLKQYPQAKTGSSFTIPVGVTEIGYYAFSCATYLNTVTIPDAVITANNIDRVNGCSGNGISQFIVGSGNANYTSIDGVIFNKAATTILAYPNNKPGSSYVMPSTVTAIQSQALAYSKDRQLKSITLSPNLISIGTYSFSNLYLPTLNIPASVTTIADLGLWTVNSVTVDSGSTSFSVADGVLYNLNKTKLIYYPYGEVRTSFTIPSTVTEIATYGISNPGSALERLVIGSSLVSIGSYNYVSNLKYLSISDDTTFNFNNFVFSRLTSVNYCGTNATTISNIDAKLSSWGNATRVCLSTPAFTLSSSSEVVNAGSAISGYTINSTGGAIASFEISPSISNTPGLRFSTQTGFISETPTVTAALRTYTITARNAVGTASQTFSVTVNPAPREVTCGTGTYTVHMGIASAGTDCTGALVIASDVTEIATQAFLDAQITSLTLPTGLLTIRHLAFAGANLFPTLVIPNSVTLLESAAFQQGQYTSLTIGNGVTAIGEATFYRNYGVRINSITFGTGLTSIGYAAFQDFGVDRLTIPEGITTLASRAFDSISSTVLVLPNSLTSVASDAFVSGNFSIVKYCGSNATVTSYAFNVPIACGAIVDFNANTGSGTMSPSISGSNSALPTNTFTRSGYAFNGWNTNSSGTGTSYAAGATFPYTTASNTTLYATWVLIAPAFAITAATENATAATAISGFSINSTGGAIASFSISPAVENGLSFDSATGLISGTPTNSALSKVYTITATNTSGTASATYTIQVAQSAAQIAAAAEAARVATEAAAAEAAEAKRIADAAAAAKLAEQEATARIVAAAIAAAEAKRVADAAAEAKRVADAAAEAKRVADIAAEAKRVADAAAEVKRLAEVAAEAKRVADAAAEVKRLAEVAAEAKRVADAAAEVKRLAEVAAEAKRVADAAAETKRLADIAAEAKRVADAAAETKRRADAAAETKRLADAAAKAKAQAQLDAQRALLTGTKKVSSIKKIAPKKAVVNLINLKPGTKIKITIKVGKK